MNLLPLFKETHARMEAAQPLTLDDLWREAESLGVLRVWTNTAGFDYRTKTDYKVTIIGYRKNTKLEIERRHTSLHCAMADAINEAREMGLGEVQ